VVRACPHCGSVFDNGSKGTDEQNRKFHAMTSDLAKQATLYGKRWPADVWKALVIEEVYKGDVIPSLDGKGFIHIRRSWTKVGKDGRSQLIERLYELGAELGVRWTDE
jgi:NinB protein